MRAKTTNPTNVVAVLRDFFHAPSDCDVLPQKKAGNAKQPKTAAWVISARSKMGTFREISFPRRSLSLSVVHVQCTRTHKTSGGSPRFPLFTAPTMDLTDAALSNPWRARGATL